MISCKKDVFFKIGLTLRKKKPILLKIFMFMDDVFLNLEKYKFGKKKNAK